MRGSQTYYFEDLAVGYEEHSPGRTIREADIVQFAGLSGDYNPLHTDDEYAAETRFGGVIAHGLLGLSISSGLFVRTHLGRNMQGAIIALMSIDWSFVAPITPGDTVRLGLRIAELSRTRSGKRGLVVMERWLHVGRDKRRVQEGEVRLLVRSRATRDTTDSNRETRGTS